LLLGATASSVRVSAAIELKAAGDTPAATGDLASRAPASTGEARWQARLRQRLGTSQRRLPLQRSWIFSPHPFVILLIHVIRGSSKWLAPKIKKSVDTLQRIP
jgi:hypothetical protein